MPAKKIFLLQPGQASVLPELRVSSDQLVAYQRTVFVLFERNFRLKQLLEFCYRLGFVLQTGDKQGISGPDQAVGIIRSDYNFLFIHGDDRFKGCTTRSL